METRFTAAVYSDPTTQHQALFCALFHERGFAKTLLF